MLDRLYILVEMLVITMCISRLYGKRYEFDYKTVVLFVVDMIIMEGINAGYLPPRINILIYPIIVGYCIWKFKCRIKEALINTILTVIVLALLQMISAICVGLILPEGTQERILLLTTNILMFLIYMAISKKMILRRMSFYFQKDDVILYTILTSCVCCIFVCIYMVRFFDGLYLGQYILLCIIIVILCIMSVSWKSYKTKSIEKDMELKAYKLYESSYKNLITEIRLGQHDLKNHINAIFAQHTTCNTFEELVERQKKYCQDIAYDNRFTDLLNAGDSMVIGFLYGKFNEACEFGIEVDYKVQQIDLSEFIPIYKLVTILGNLIDNAIEALKESDIKKLYVSLTEENSVLRIEVRNTNKAIEWKYVQAMFRKGYSTKGENRGLGLYSVKKIGKEYGFNVEFCNKTILNENWVSFEIKINKRLLQE